MGMSCFLILLRIVVGAEEIVRVVLVVGAHRTCAVRRQFAPGASA